jgi:alpha-mannosidase
VKTGTDRLVPAAPFFDTLADHVQDAPRIVPLVAAPATGPFRDAVSIRIEPRLYWHASTLLYTQDGSDPVMSSRAETPEGGTPGTNSPQYAGPFFVGRTSTIKAAVFDVHGGGIGPVSELKITVEDTTPPTVVRVTPAYASPLLRVEFSEPLAESGLAAGSFTLKPAIAVRSVRKGANTCEAIVELASAPEIDRAYRIEIAGVKDDSPAHNAMKPVALDLVVKGPVFKLDQIAREQMGTEIRDVPGLPVKGKDAWTLNMSVRLEKQPADRTVIAGFGRCEQASDGVARYMTKFPRGIHFWSHNRDLEGRTPLDLGRWQMLTATYDGRVLRLYKDGKKLGEREVELADDENAVRFAPPDPWEQKRRFEGEIRGFSIWNEALSEDAIQALWSAASPR